MCLTCLKVTIIYVLIQHFQWTVSGPAGRLGEVVAPHVTTVLGHEHVHAPTHHQLKVGNHAKEMVQKRMSVIGVPVLVDFFLLKWIPQIVPKMASLLMKCFLCVWFWFNSTYNKDSRLTIFGTCIMHHFMIWNKGLHCLYPSRNRLSANRNRHYKMSACSGTKR